MAHRYALACALALAAAASGTPAARAQQLQRLTVTAFTLSTDNPHPGMEAPFNLIVRLHVRERVGGIENLDLPLLSDLELLGDERRYTADASGTTYVEVVRVVAHHTGRIDVAPATLDAVDALDGKAKRYSTNGLSLTIGGLAPGTTADVGAAIVGFMLRVLLWSALIVAAAIALVVWLIVRGRRNARPPVVQSPPAAPAPAPPPSMRDVLQGAAQALRSDPTRAGAVRARHQIRAFVGAGDRETLADVLRRPQAAQGTMPHVLRALERAAFTFDDDLPAAVNDAIDAMEMS